MNTARSPAPGDSHHTFTMPSTPAPSAPSVSPDSPSFSTPSPTRDAGIGGLREQIFANATTLFPQLVATSRSYSKTGSFDPKEMFEVITTSSNSTFQATLVGGPLTARRPVARGASADGVAEALSGLLKVLGEALGWYADTLLGEMESAEATECGMVNFTLVEGGFHFAHVQRWAQTQMTGV